MSKQRLYVKWHRQRRIERNAATDGGIVTWWRKTAAENRQAAESTHLPLVTREDCCSLAIQADEVADKLQKLADKLQSLKQIR